MSIPFSQYLKIKDKICIAHFGPWTEYLVQLELLRPNIEKTFPGAIITIAGRNSNVKRKDFGYFFEIVNDMRNHPVELFLEKNNIPYEISTPNISSNCRKCRIITDRNADILRKYVMSRGFDVTDHYPYDWFIGTENGEIFENAGKGIRTTLIESGSGTSLFRKMFPGQEVLKFSSLVV